MNEIVYPVILTYEDNLIYVGVPDLKIDNYASYGETFDEAIQSAKEIITLHLCDLEEEGKEFPQRSEAKNLKNQLEENQEIIYVNLWLPYEKSLVKIEYKKKTLSIPVWLDLLATNKNLNFSQILQKALKKELGITKH
ncbi:MAG: type II toxin-antitoxin system HicB family antitoxin [Fusobacteriaceae bacterium]